MLGRDVARAAEAAGHEVSALDRAAADVTDAAAVETAVRERRPKAVVNCAAYTAVDAAEQEPEEALRVNAHGAANVARAAGAVGASVAYPSTDYVFDGAKGSPYAESDTPNPLSSYGRSKLAGERATAEANPRHHLARSSWLFGLAGRNFVETMLELGAERGEVVVVDDQIGCPTYTGHLAGALVRLLATDAFGVHHMAAAGRCSWYEFAVEIFAQAGVDCRVLPCTTAESGRPAPRPAFSALETERAQAVRLPGWREGLAAYLAERKVRA
jgi:dTDP-4-dehydrorhamnose reductase